MYLLPLRGQVLNLTGLFMIKYSYYPKTPQLISDYGEWTNNTEISFLGCENTVDVFTQRTF